ncbi:MAG: hypothetical protein WA777_08960 [Rhodanobacter sp.]
MQKWLLSRLFSDKEQPAPRFAFYGTINWMRALSLSVDANGFGNDALRLFYSNIQSRPLDTVVDTVIFENIFMAFNHVAGLVSISNEVDNAYDISRSVISGWYHGIYSAANAMAVAASGSLMDSHEATAMAWQIGLVQNDLVPQPFSPMLSNVLSATCDAELSAYRGSNGFDLNHAPRTIEEAWGGILSYLKGTADYERGRIEKLVRAGPEFKALRVENFRTKAAQEVRDSYFKNAQVNFLVQASRYVGKANYRDSIFLSYGEDRRDQIDRFLVDLGHVATAFLRMACAYCSRRVEPGTWDLFVDDIEANSRLSLNAELLRL